MAARYEDEDEAFQDEETSVLTFPPDVEAAISQVLPSTDPLDRADFNPVEYINTIFPNEQSLSQIDPIASKFKLKIRRLDDKIRVVVRGQSNVGDEGRRALGEAQRGIQDLFTRIKDIKRKADTSERMVNEITRDIKQLDNAKKHLTASIVALNHLYMLVGSLDTLKTLSKQRQYKEISQVLQVCVNVFGHFDGYRHIKHIADLAERIATLKTQLRKQIMEDFETNVNAKGNPNPQQVQVLNEACYAVDVLDPDFKTDIVGWYIKRRLVDYNNLFHETLDTAQPEKIDRRYAWLKRALESFEADCPHLFPDHWKMSELIALDFCRITKRDLGSVLQQRKATLDVKLLLFAVKKTLKFEFFLTQRYYPQVADKMKIKTEQSHRRGPSRGGPKDHDAEDFDGADSRDSMESARDNDDAASQRSAESKESVRDRFLKYKKELEKQKGGGKDPAAEKEKEKAAIEIKSPFAGAVSSVFEPFMSIYNEETDRKLSEMIGGFATNFKQSVPEEERGHPAKVLPSCADIFLFYRDALSQLAPLSTAEPMMGLAVVFKKYLRMYAQKVLLGNIPKGSAPAPPTSLVDKATPLTSSKDEVRLTAAEVHTTCCILNSAEYCLETTRQLQGKLKEKIDEEFRKKIDMTDEEDLFDEVINQAMTTMVRSLETMCDPALSAMARVTWATIEAVGDQSPYVGVVQQSIVHLVPSVRDGIATGKYYTAFCNKFVNSFIPRVVNQIFKCKPISQVGAEQLLLDVQSIKASLLELPSVGSPIASNPPASYSRFVAKNMGRAEMIIKVVLTPFEPPEACVHNYINLVGDADLSTFQKILDIKGLKKSDRDVLVDLFKKLQPQAAVAPNAQASAPAAAASKSEDSLSDAFRMAAPGILKLEKLIKRL